MQKDQIHPHSGAIASQGGNDWPCSQWPLHRTTFTVSVLREKERERERKSERVTKESQLDAARFSVFVPTPSEREGRLTF